MRASQSNPRSLPALWKTRMAKKVSRKAAHKLRTETDRLARQSNRTKEQLDKVQRAADSIVEITTEHKESQEPSST